MLPQNFPPVSMPCISHQSNTSGSLQLTVGSTMFKD